MAPGSFPAPVPPRRAVVVLLTGVGGLIVVGCALAVLARSLAPDLAVTGVDADVTGYLVANRRPWLNIVTLVASRLADLQVVAAFVLALGVAVWRRSGRGNLLWIPGLAGGGALLISVAAKLLTGRGRPPLSVALVDAYGMAFPSGHALRALAVYGALAWILAASVRARPLRVVTWACAGALIAAVGFSRIYLGAHWLTDVLAGYLLGAAWLALVLAFTQGSRKQSTQQADGEVRLGSRAGVGS